MSKWFATQITSIHLIICLSRRDRLRFEILFFDAKCRNSSRSQKKCKAEIAKNQKGFPYSTLYYQVVVDRNDGKALQQVQRCLRAVVQKIIIIRSSWGLCQVRLLDSGALMICSLNELKSITSIEDRRRQVWKIRPWKWIPWVWDFYYFRFLRLEFLASSVFPSSESGSPWMGIWRRILTHTVREKVKSHKGI